jgi:hypothetical protein
MVVLHTRFMKRSLCSLCCRQGRPAIRGGPAKVDRVARRHCCFGSDFYSQDLPARQTREQALMIAVIDSAINRRLKPVVRFRAGARQPDPLGPDRQMDRRAGTNVSDRQGGRRQPRWQRDQTLIAFDAFDYAIQRIVFPDEACDECSRRLLVEPVRRADLNDGSFVEHGYAIRHRQRFALVVRDIDDGDAEHLVDLLQLDLHMLAQLFIERAEGLIHQNEGRLKHQRPGKRDALLLAARELGWLAVLELLQPHHFEGAHDARPDVGLRHLSHGQREGDIVRHAHMRKQRVVLEHHADISFVGRQAVDRFAVERNHALAGPFEARQHVQGRGLAGT